jgi:hypothetical protein
MAPNLSPLSPWHYTYYEEAKADSSGNQEQWCEEGVTSE